MGEKTCVFSQSKSVLFSTGLHSETNYSKSDVEVLFIINFIF